MSAKPEFRRSERCGLERIIKLEGDLTLSPYYAVSYNLSDGGMYFKSLFELYQGAHILIRIDDYTISRQYALAKVVWSRKLEDNSIFRYGVGVEFLQTSKKHDQKAFPTVAPHMVAADAKEGGVVVRMQNRLPE